MLYGAAMNEFPRYALYYAPAVDSALWRFGSAALGYDALTGEDIPFAVPAGCDGSEWPASSAWRH